MQLPTYVQVTEVVTRDGLQNEDRIVSTREKLRIVRGLVRAGVTAIEVTSFVRPDVVPQLADAAEVIAGLPKDPRVLYSALVPNLRGARRALDAGVTQLHLVVSASEKHNLANLNCTVDESLAHLAEVCAWASSDYLESTFEVTLATAFHCPFTGRTPLERATLVLRKLVDLGIRRITLADTDGAANPRQIWETVTAVKARFPEVSWGLHLHNTRDMGLANVLAGLQAGITAFDASLGGIGGCPFAPGATGNISTEDLVHMLHEMGIETGINLHGLLACDSQLRAVVGHELPSMVAKAGPSSRLHPFQSTAIAGAAMPVAKEVLPGN
ncbi:MAG: hydroxymethylglutaryl-CoA lyase [Ktedonobacterales bacterium]